MAVWYESDNPNGFRTGQRFGIDGPMLTFMADGLGGDSLGHWHWCWGGGQSMSAPAVIDKSPYRVPLMAELAAPADDAPTVVSTFSGCGGSCLGYRLAGYRVLWASELVPIAADSYRANFPETILDPRDMRLVEASEILAVTGLEVGELDLLDGSPPCQPFSTAGKRHQTWGKVRDYGDHKQVADDLFFEYARLVDGLKPRVFVAENVSGLIKGTAKGYFLDILRRLKACGYRVEARLLDAQWLGVPQARQRIIFVGVREDLGLAPAFPSPLPYRYSVRDALPWIGGIRLGAHGFQKERQLDPNREPSSTVAASGLGSYGYDVTPTGDGFEHCYEGGIDDPAGTDRAGRVVGVEARVIHDTGGAWGAGDITDRPAPTVTVGQRSRNSTHSQVEAGVLPPSRTRAYEGEAVYGLTLLDPERPSPTITIGSPGNDIAPPVERRRFTIDEVKRLCAFPDDFVLVGSYAEQWARLGNAVPPVMMQHIAAVIRDEILSKVPR